MTVHESLRVVIAYDGSPSAAPAVRAAASLFPSARAYLATVPPQITLPVETTFPGIPAMSPDAVQQVYEQVGAEARRQATETAQEAVEQARALGLQAEIVDVSPSARASATLLDTAHRHEADVLVCGTRGRGAFARALLGSTSSRLLHETDLPLLVVPDGAGTLDGPAVLAYDGSDGAESAIAAAGRLLPGRAAVVVHAWVPAFHRQVAARALARASDEVGEIVGVIQEAFADSAAATTEAGVKAARAAGLDAQGETVEASDGGWRAVAAAAQTRGAAVIVTGTRGLGAARSVLLGSVSSGLVQNAELPTLVVPHEPADD